MHFLCENLQQKTSRWIVREAAETVQVIILPEQSVSENPSQEFIRILTAEQEG